MNTFDKLVAHYPFIVMLSAEQAHNQSDVNDRHTLEMAGVLYQSKLLYIAAEGRYQGVREMSFVVGCPSYTDVAYLISLGLTAYEQDSVLVIDKGSDTATLIHADKTVTIGKRLSPAIGGDNMTNTTTIEGVTYVVI